MSGGHPIVTSPPPKSNPCIITGQLVAGFGPWFPVIYSTGVTPILVTSAAADSDSTMAKNVLMLLDVHTMRLIRPDPKMEYLFNSSEETLRYLCSDRCVELSEQDLRGLGLYWLPVFYEDDTQQEIYDAPNCTTLNEWFTEKAAAAKKNVVAGDKCKTEEHSACATDKKQKQIESATASASSSSSPLK